MTVCRSSGALLLILLAAGCGGNKVLVPPRLDLRPYGQRGVGGHGVALERVGHPEGGAGLARGGRAELRGAGSQDGVRAAREPDREPGGAGHVGDVAETVALGAIERDV